MTCRFPVVATAAIATATLAGGLIAAQSRQSASAAQSQAPAVQRPVVVELFTSLGCSDCPPADALLARVHREEPEVLALDLHVTYWNDASWADPYSLPSTDARQRQYAERRGDAAVYTPQAVVDGQQSFVGSDARAMAVALGQAKSKIAAGQAVPLAIRRSPQALHVFIGSGRGAGAVWLFGFDPAHTTAVAGGENSGATISEVNVVRSITRLGGWQGQRTELETRTPAGTRFAVLLQRTDGTILAATSD